MSYIITQEDIDILRQSNRKLYSKIELLNHDFKIIDSLEGELVSDSFTNDATSDIRRTYSCELFVKNSSFLVGSDKKIWIDKYIRPYIGIKSQRTQKIIWYLQGTFVFNEPDYSFNETTKSVKLTCSDLMCTLNGDRGGFIEGLENDIKEGVNIRTAIIGTLQDAGITKYNVVDIDKEVPYDLKYEVGSKYYDILKQLVELYAGYEMFFDLEGIFIVQKIPTTKDEKSILDKTVFAPLVISEDISQSFNNIYNCTQVWGKTLETDYYTSTASTTDGINYTATIQKLMADGVTYEVDTTFTGYENFGKYGVKIPQINGVNPTLNINGFGAIPIVEDNGSETLASGRLLANTDYVFKYRQDTNDMLLLGQYQAYGEYINEETDCPFSTVNLGYIIKQVLNYDELDSDSLCIQRAKYETWLATKMLDTIKLDIVPIPFLDVNWKVTYTPKMTGKTQDYIVKTIDSSNSESTMSITMIRYSELYPDIIPNT